MMAENPSLFKEKVQETLRKHTDAINKHTAKGTYFFDYGNAFTGSFSCGADIMAEHRFFRYPSYVQDIMGPMCFDFGLDLPLGLCSGTRRFTKKQIPLPARYWKKWQNSSIEIQQQMQDNIQWIKAQENKLVVGLKLEFYMQMLSCKIAEAFNQAIAKRNYNSSSWERSS
jgi:urocanate hydratase